MGGLDQGRSVTFSPLSLLFYGVLYGCKWECNSTQNAPYLSWLGIRHVLGPTVRVPTLGRAIDEAWNNINRRREFVRESTGSQWRLKRE